MIVFPNAPIFILFFLLILSENINCINKNENITQLKHMIDNKVLHDDLLELERLILQSLELDELKLPILKPETTKYINLSNFEKIEIVINNDETYNYIIPTFKANAEDLIKYEHITKQQLIESHNSENSVFIKRKNVILRTLRIVKFMLTPMEAYKNTQQLKDSLIALNNIFRDPNEEMEESSTSCMYEFKRIFLFKKMRKKKRLKMFPRKTLDDNKEDILNSKDLFFTTHPNIDYMIKLDKLSNYYNLGLFNLVGSNLIALGHFIVLRLALKEFHKYFETMELKFFSWQKILNFNMSDRFKAIDLMCSSGITYEAETKRRKQYLKVSRRSSPEECNILELIIHYLNKYQMELITSAYQVNLKIHALLEHSHIKEEFFKFMCDNNNINCNIYDSHKFTSEYYKKIPSESDISESPLINPYNIYVNFLYFIKRYNYFSHKNILYVHFLNLTGILNFESKAFVSSLYLPGYFNAIELSFDEKSKIMELYDYLLECVELCHKKDKKYKILSYDIDLLLKDEKSHSPKCNMCQGTLFYINSKSEENVSMFQKFYTYVTEVVKVNNISSLIKDMNVYEDYDNFLTNDINWYTFLLLFRFSTYKEIAHKNLAEAMYLNLKKEDKFKRTITTSYWFPSPIKKAYSLYVRKNKSMNLVEKLEGLLSSGAIEKMKKCIQFVVHVNSFLQLDFFYYLNEPPLGEQRIYPLSMMLEHKFKEWHDNSSMGYFFLNYEDEDMRKQIKEKIRNGQIVIPKYSKWILILKKYIEKSYESYFNQRNVKNLYKYHNDYNSNSKIMLMKDSYDLYSKKYEDIIFFADIFNLRKYLTATPRAKKRRDKLYYYINTIAGNTINLYKYGIMYGFTINKIYLKEMTDELFAIYKMNIDTFSDISFLQTVYLLFKKIENSYNEHRRNDKMSMNNVFFFNVRRDYSKLNKQEREEEINASMASKYFSKTLFSVFQMMFSVKLSNNAEYLDRKYGTDSMIGLTVHEQPFYSLAYAYYGSLMDNLTNSLLPIYAKKPITQLKYGKTFIFSNLYKLCYHIYSILNLNNLSLLCENQAITSSNYYSSKKLAQFIDRKFIPIVATFFVLRVNTVIEEAKTTPKPYLDQFLWPTSAVPITFLSIYMATNTYLGNDRFFPSGFNEYLRGQTEHVAHPRPTPKPSVHSITKKTMIGVINGVAITVFMHHFMRWFAFYENFVYVFVNNVRVFERFFKAIEYHIGNFIRSNFKRLTTDALLNSMERAYRAIKNKGYHKEAMEARLSAKKVNKRSILGNFEENVASLTPQDIETLLKDENFLYVDDSSFFEESDESESFLNERKTVCYRETDRNNLNLIPYTRWTQREASDDSTDATSSKYEKQKKKKKVKKKRKNIDEKSLSETEDNQIDEIMMISRRASSESEYIDYDRSSTYCTKI
ncbi:cytoadherence linked asexual protein 3.2, putative [Plasmodium gallinaceum]|uniref:Cytoadherence linked asexual protein 3.2, putative n=1 Tax=Plasmodium gallinaceum TaxID=5849 RepID=A0A1J1GW60_PLAGA|nr:cytoadherence linked asexual protein 3.2, putative [Plasmodium gallinaceum]CRG95253.1 cytoadherence linked asexual protein 3.2, putative [Plasmodium gallinaceum]